MKKEYFKPEVISENITTEYMIADSIQFGEDGPADTNERRGKWGDVWSK